MADERGSPVSPFQRLTGRARHPPAFSHLMSGRVKTEKLSAGICFPHCPPRADGAQDSRHFRFVPILLKKSSLADQRNFFSATGAPRARPWSPPASRPASCRRWHILEAGWLLYTDQYCGWR